jgi:hypothetical protein
MDGVAKVLEENVEVIRRNWDDANKVAAGLYDPMESVVVQPTPVRNWLPLVLLALAWFVHLSLPWQLLMWVGTCALMVYGCSGENGTRLRHLVWAVLFMFLIIIWTMPGWSDHPNLYVHYKHHWHEGLVAGVLWVLEFGAREITLCVMTGALVYLWFNPRRVQILPATFIAAPYTAAVVETVLLHVLPFPAFVTFAALDSLVVRDLGLMPMFLILHGLFSITPLWVGILLHLLWNWWSVRPAAFTTLAMDILAPSARPGLHIEPICTDWLPLGDVRPGARLRKPRCRECETVGKGGYSLAGPRFSFSRVFCYKTCAHNMVRAAAHRMGGVPPRYKNEPDFLLAEEKCMDEWRQMAPLVIDWLLNVPHRVFVQRPPLKRLTVNQWLKRYPSGQARKMKNNWLATSEPLKDDYGCFVKKEKTTLTNDVDAYADPHMFVGCHTFSQGGHVVPDPRGISCPPEAFRVEVGPDCDYYNQKLQHLMSGQIFYAIGVSSEVFGHWLDWVTYNYDWALAVTGDDVLILRKRGEEWEVASLDMKRYDMHMHKAAFETSWELMETWRLYRLAWRMQKQAKLRTYRIRSTEGFGQLKVRYTQASGNGDTISTNSLVAVIPAIYAMTHGYDVHECYWKAGFYPTGGWQPYRRGHMNFDFLQRLPLLDRNGDITPIPKPGRILSRAFWSPNQLRASNRLPFCKAVIQSIRKDVMHCPLLNDLVARIEELSPGDSKIHLGRDALDVERMRAARPHKEARSAEMDLSIRYGISISDIRLMRQRIRAWKPGEFLDDHTTRRAFQRLVEVDTL